MLIERFKSPCGIELEIKKHTGTGFIASLVNGPKLTQSFRCDHGAYAFTPDGFELRTKLGQIAARFQFIDPNKQK